MVLTEDGSACAVALARLLKDLVWHDNIQEQTVFRRPRIELKGSAAATAGRACVNLNRLSCEILC